MNNMSLNETVSLLRKLDIKPSKNLGQNFLVDKNILKKIILKSNLSSADTVVEVGTGLGTLTKEMLGRVKKVISYEIDKRLYKYLSHELSIYDNLELINEDVLEAEIPFHDKVVSNIPYTISGPILEKLFYNPQSTPATLIIEKSISEKLKNYAVYQNYSRIAVTFNAFMNAVETDDISRNSFFPVPKINLSLINIVPRPKVHPFLRKAENRQFFIKFIAGLTQYKNKNISSAIAFFIKNEGSLNLSKSAVTQLLKNMDIVEDKLFKFDIDSLIEICGKICQIKN